MKARKWLLVAAAVGITASLAIAGVFLCQSCGAEMLSKYLPKTARRFVAGRILRAAQRKPYAADRLIGYTKVLIWDAEDFPEVWRPLCTSLANQGTWSAAKVACERVSSVEKSDADYQSTLGNVYENLKDYSHAANAYAAAAQLRPDEPLFKEQTLWMSLAAHRYNDAVHAATALVEYGKTKPTKVDVKKAYTALGFAYAQFGNQRERSAAYAMGLADFRDPSCSLGQDADGRFSIACVGVSRHSGRRVSSCMGAGCK
jgi:tetratricopeptide (TPR) repeat protein